MNEKDSINRRKVITGIGAGLATMAISPVFAGARNVNTLSLQSAKLEDPTTKISKTSV